jgi:hypothetical protein
MSRTGLLTGETSPQSKTNIPGKVTFHLASAILQHKRECLFSRTQSILHDIWEQILLSMRSEKPPAEIRGIISTSSPGQGSRADSRRTDPERSHVCSDPRSGLAHSRRPSPHALSTWQHTPSEAFSGVPVNLFSTASATRLSNEQCMTRIHKNRDERQWK